MTKLIRNAVLFAALSLFSGLAFAGSVNINTADAQSLAENIKGVGPKIAVRIIEHREANGPFQSVDDLQQVKGIGEKTVAKNRDVLQIEGSSDSQ